METVKFYGNRRRSETSSSDESVGDVDPCYIPSQEDVDSHESGKSFQYDSDASFEDLSSTTITTEAIAGTTGWGALQTRNRTFECTTNEELLFSDELPSDRAIEPIDIYKIFVSEKVIDLIVSETNRFFEDTMGATPNTRHSKVKQ